MMLPDPPSMSHSLSQCLACDTSRVYSVYSIYALFDVVLHNFGASLSSFESSANDTKLSSPLKCLLSPIVSFVAFRSSLRVLNQPDIARCLAARRDDAYFL